MMYRHRYTCRSVTVFLIALALFIFFQTTFLISFHTTYPPYGQESAASQSGGVGSFFYAKTAAFALAEEEFNSSAGTQTSASDATADQAEGMGTPDGQAETSVSGEEAGAYDYAVNILNEQENNNENTLRIALITMGILIVLGIMSGIFYYLKELIELKREKKTEQPMIRGPPSIQGTDNTMDEDEIMEAYLQSKTKNNEEKFLDKIRKAEEIRQERIKQNIIRREMEIIRKENEWYMVVCSEFVKYLRQGLNLESASGMLSVEGYPEQMVKNAQREIVKLANYIKKELQKGYRPADIRRRLITAGWKGKDELIDMVFELIFASRKR